MADENLLAKRGKALEEEYFHRKEKELIEKLRKKSAADAQIKELSEATGIPDEDVLRTLQELGYTPDTVAVLHLVPLIQVAWADRKVTPQEREMILEASSLHGVAGGSAAYLQLTDWLDNRPSDEFFEQTLRIIGTILQTNPEAQGMSGSDVLADSIRVAEASGGILGFGNKISDEERAMLQRIADAVGADGKTSA
jgi:Mitochondrial ATPase inhibitor, IATP.